MNVERLNVIAIALSRELEESKVTEKLKQLVAVMQQGVAKADRANEKAVFNALREVKQAVLDAASDNFKPAWRQLVEEIGASTILGRGLIATIEPIVARYPLSRPGALKEIGVISDRLAQLQSALKEAKSCLRVLKIGEESLDPNGCEISVLIPRNAVSNCLSELAIELKEIGFILNTFSEMATGSRDPLKIRSVASCDFQISLDAALPWAVATAVCIERIVTLYKQTLEIRKIQSELKKQGIAKEVASGIEDHANDKMAEGIETIAIEVVDKYGCVVDGGRRNELTNAMRISLAKLATRIDRGYNFEVRVERVRESGEDGKLGEKQEQAFATIGSAAQSMQYIKSDGPAILSLPEANEEKSNNKS